MAVAETKTLTGTDAFSPRRARFCGDGPCFCGSCLPACWPAGLDVRLDLRGYRYPQRNHHVGVFAAVEPRADRTAHAAAQGDKDLGQGVGVLVRACDDHGLCCGRNRGTRQCLKPAVDCMVVGPGNLRSRVWSPHMVNGCEPVL